MITFGTQISSKERKILVEYLTKTQGRAVAAKVTSAYAYVDNDDSRDVSIIDVETHKLRVVDMIPVGTDPHLVLIRAIKPS
jgi:YVTN family beta-propeller protein